MAKASLELQSYWANFCMRAQQLGWSQGRTDMLARTNPTRSSMFDFLKGVTVQLLQLLAERSQGINRVQKKEIAHKTSSKTGSNRSWHRPVEKLRLAEKQHHAKRRLLQCLCSGFTNQQSKHKPIAPFDIHETHLTSQGAAKGKHVFALRTSPATTGPNAKSIGGAARAVRADSFSCSPNMRISRISAMQVRKLVEHLSKNLTFFTQCTFT